MVCCMQGMDVDTSMYFIQGHNISECEWMDLIQNQCWVSCVRGSGRIYPGFKFWVVMNKPCCRVKDLDYYS